MFDSDQRVIILQRDCGDALRLCRILVRFGTLHKPVSRIEIQLSRSEIIIEGAQYFFILFKLGKSGKVCGFLIYPALRNITHRNADKRAVSGKEPEHPVSRCAEDLYRLFLRKEFRSHKLRRKSP